MNQLPRHRLDKTTGNQNSEKIEIERTNVLPDEVASASLEVKKKMRKNLHIFTSKDKRTLFNT